MILGKWRLLSQGGRPVPAGRKETVEFTADGKQTTIMMTQTLNNTYKFVDDQTIQQYFRDQPTSKYIVAVTKSDLSLACPTNQDLDVTYKRVN